MKTPDERLFKTFGSIILLCASLLATESYAVTVNNCTAACTASYENCLKTTPNPTTSCMPVYQGCLRNCGMGK